MFQPSPLTPSFTHYLPCSGTGRCALSYAILRNKADVVAYLRSIGAPETFEDVEPYLRRVGVLDVRFQEGGITLRGTAVDIPLGEAPADAPTRIGRAPRVGPMSPWCRWNTPLQRLFVHANWLI